MLSTACTTVCAAQALYLRTEIGKNLRRAFIVHATALHAVVRQRLNHLPALKPTQRPERFAHHAKLSLGGKIGAVGFRKNAPGQHNIRAASRIRQVNILHCQEFRILRAGLRAASPQRR